MIANAAEQLISKAQTSQAKYRRGLGVPIHELSGAVNSFWETRLMEKWSIVGATTCWRKEVELQGC